jgi:hypothetical protein
MGRLDTAEVRAGLRPGNATGCGSRSPWSGARRLDEISLSAGGPSDLARKATIQLKVHRQLVQSIPLDDADIECLIQGLQLVAPCTQRIERLIDLLEQVRSPDPRGERRSGQVVEEGRTGNTLRKLCASIAIRDFPMCDCQGYRAAPRALASGRMNGRIPFTMRDR